MACAYCFYRCKSSLYPETPTHRMSDDVLEELVKQAMTQAGDHVVFIWQGGEPTLMGKAYFEKVVSLQKKYGEDQRVGNALQTNGLLIDEGWIRFLKEYNFLIGLSLDGPRHVHDYYRKNIDGISTWDESVGCAKRLMAAGVETNVLCVITDYSVNYPDEIYSFHKQCGFMHMQYIPCVEPHPDDPARWASYCALPKAYGEFLCRLFDLWMEDIVHGQTTSIRFFESILYRYADSEAPECSLLERCGVYLAVEHNGDVYPCDFYVEPDLLLGNLMTDSLSELLNSGRQRSFGTMKARLPNECGSCEWISICRGGCTRHRLPLGRVDSQNYFCESYKTFFRYADDRMKDMAQSVHQSRSIMPLGTALTGNKIGRNAPCPCGSGRKHKKCCGH